MDLFSLRLYTFKILIIKDKNSFFRIKNLRKEGITMKLKRIITITTLAIVMATSTGTMGITANAANTSNKNFSIAVAPNIKKSSTTAVRLKQDSTSSYVNYKVKADG